MSIRLHCSLDNGFCCWAGTMLTAALKAFFDYSFSGPSDTIARTTDTRDADHGLASSLVLALYMAEKPDQQNLL